jgi:pSer/pThr/pTyr-binding forkhead associated (FHA) protein
VPAYQSGALAGMSGAADAPEAEIPATRVVPPANAVACVKCSRLVDSTLPFCGHCGTRVTAAVGAGACTSCGATYMEGVDLFCARCGNRVGQRVSIQINSPLATLVLGAKHRDHGPKLALLDEGGAVASTFSLERGEAVVGRGDADIRFDDVFLSPLHARVELREGELWVRDLGSRNGTWTFIDGAARLTDGDVILVGSQLLRFRRLGYPGPHPPEADATRRMGSLVPSADVAVMEQLRADGSVRDTFHLSPARTVLLGRESGDWVFPYDRTMSGRHAEVRSQDAEFFVHDAGSRNGVALAVRGERVLKKGQRILLGDQVLRVESVGL